MMDFRSKFTIYPLLISIRFNDEMEPNLNVIVWLLKVYLFAPYNQSISEAPNELQFQYSKNREETNLHHIRVTWVKGMS